MMAWIYTAHLLTILVSVLTKGTIPIQEHMFFVSKSFELPSMSFKTIITRGILQCAAICALIPECKSTNYRRKKPGTKMTDCELNHSKQSFKNRKANDDIIYLELKAFSMQTMHSVL